MRLDAFLKISRLVPRRSVAGDLCRDGKVFANGGPAKAGRTVRAGDCIRIETPGKELTVRIVELPAKKNVSKAVARTLYEITGERRFDFWGEEIGPKGGRSPAGPAPEPAPGEGKD